jgi:carbonic anhydrase
VSTWIESITEANKLFVERIDSDQLPVERPPGQFVVVTCMDPRVNLEAIGISPFQANGSLGSATRVIRTLGGIPEARSLVVGLHLAGIQEVAILMHSDCGAMAAWNRANVLLENLQANLGPSFEQFAELAGGSDVDSLRVWLRAFDDPRRAVVREVERLRAEPFIPPATPIHGLVFDLASGEVEVVINGYE